MPDDPLARPPIVCRWLVHLASWMVPRQQRSGWRARRNSGLGNLWILVSRGELAGEAWAEIASCCRGAFADAFSLRFGRQSFRHWVQGPSFVLAAVAVVLCVTGVLSRGFAGTRALVEVARTVTFASLDAKQDTIVAHAFPFGFALIVGIVLVGIGRLPLCQHGWRYWSFLALKTISVVAIVPVLWFEAGAAIRAYIPSSELRVVLAGLILTLVFVIGFGCALEWSFADQGRRCPVCLKRLTMPVTFGSWASVLEPATMELLCDAGHGSLCVPGTVAAGPDHWTPLDASWRELFQARP